MITDRQWRIFGLVRQEGQTLKNAADIMGVTPKVASTLLGALKKAEPELFPVESRRKGLKSYRPDMDENVKINFNRIDTYGRIDSEDVWCLKCDELIEECACGRKYN